MPPPLHSLPPRKRQKTDVDDSFRRLVQLEAEVISAVAKNTSLNALVDLLDLAHQATDAQLLTKTLYALYRTFVVIVDNGKLQVSGDSDAKLVRTWLWERLAHFADQLGSCLKDEDKEVKVSSLRILLSLLKHLSVSLGDQSSDNDGSPLLFHTSFFRRIVSFLLKCPPSKRPTHRQRQGLHVPENIQSDGKLDGEVKDAFVRSWLSPCQDIRWFFLRDAVAVLTRDPVEIEQHTRAVNMLSILEALTAFSTETSESKRWWIAELAIESFNGNNDLPAKPTDQEELDDDNEIEQDDWRKFFEDSDNGPADKTASKTTRGRIHKLSVRQSLHSEASHRAVFTRAWLTLLSHLPTGSDSRDVLAIRVLNIMHRGILPYLTRPVLVMDWVSACVDRGGTVGLLALNTLFVLIKEYNLDYPLFYTRLYAFLDRDLLLLKHRARFFRLTEMFLSSTHLPATLLASFIKRLSRLSLYAPPSAIVMIIPFTYNILKRHPALMVMIHRLPDEPGQLEKDPFRAEEQNPNLTHAIDSSLWELHTHRQHYQSAVSTMVRIVEEAFTKPSYTMEDFLDHTYGTLLDSEFERKLKKEPSLAMQSEGNLFSVLPTDEHNIDTTCSAYQLWSYSDQ